MLIGQIQAPEDAVAPSPPPAPTPVPAPLPPQEETQPPTQENAVETLPTIAITPPATQPPPAPLPAEAPRSESFFRFFIHHMQTDPGARLCACSDPFPFHDAYTAYRGLDVVLLDCRFPHRDHAVVTPAFRRIAVLVHVDATTIPSG